MSVLEFIAAVVGSLAWPLVVAVVVVLLRSQLRDLADKLIARIAGLTEMSGLGLSFKFGESLDVLEQNVKEIKGIVASDHAGASQETTVLRDGARTEPARSSERATGSLASEEPLVTLLRAYWVVESAAERALERHGLNPESRPVGVVQAIRLLEQEGVVNDRGFRGIVTELVSLRNQAVHNRVEVAVEDADRFTWIADDIAEFLDRL